MSSFQESFSPYGNLGLHGVRLPVLQIEKKFYERLGISESADNFAFLKELCNRAYKDKGINKLENAKEYISRVKMELETLNELGFVDYILLIWDIINFCKENDIPTGPGRGSAAGSAVLYFLGVTNIDPIKHGLFFERFVSKSRAKKTIVDGITYLDGSLLPDVDSDICYYKRKLVLKYIQDRYPGKTCKMLTVNTLSGKLVLKETLKTVLEYSEEDVKVFAGYVEKVFGNVEELADTAERSAPLQKWLALPRQPYEIVSPKQAFDIARKLEDLPKNFGVHPSAVVVSYNPLEDFCPTQIAKIKKEEAGLGEEEVQAVSGFDMNWISEFAVKVDILGLRAVSIVDDVCKMLKLDPSTINLDDPKVYDPLQDLRTPHGIFQIEANTQYKACREVKPNSLAEVSDLMALARPGSLDYIKDYVANKAGKVVEPIEPNLDRILHNTKHVALYQEQMMQIASQVFGFTLDEAETLRRIVGKKAVEKMPEWKEKVYAKAIEKNLDVKVADIYWKILNDSANYSFNKSHAVSYGTLATLTLYLKFNHPQQFFLALFNMSKHEPKPHEEISKISKELHCFGIKLLPPDLMLSDMEFKAEGPDIRYGLALLKGISEKTMEAVLSFRNSRTANKFELFQSAKQAGLNVGVLSSLIQAGALASIRGSRSYNVMEAQVFNLLTDSEKPYILQLGAEFNYDLFKLLKAVVKEVRKRENGKTPIVKESRYETIKKKSENYLKIYQMNVKNERLANWFFENKLLGYVYSSTLYSIMKDEIEGLSPLDSFDSFENDDKVICAGLVVEAQNTKSKQGKKMFRMTIEDGNKQLTTIFFDKPFEKWIENHTDKKGEFQLPKKEDLVYIVGKKSNDIIFLTSMTTLEGKVYLKLSDLS